MEFEISFYDISQLLIIALRILSFYHNNRNFLNIKRVFFEELEKEIANAGFRINKKKTRIQYRDSRQEVTGVVVNKKLHVSRDYYKKTRAMVYGRP